MKKFRLYTFLRRLHTYSAFTLLGFVLMYFTTGFLLAHEDSFDIAAPQETVKEQRADLSGKPAGAVAEHFRAQYGGRVERVWEDEAGMLFVEIRRPGQKFLAMVAADRRSARVEEERAGTFKTVTAFHRIHGYGGGFAYNLYVFLGDLSALALIVFAATGIYMWLKLERRRLAGLALLACSCGLTAWVILAFW